MTSVPDPQLARLQELLGIEATQGLSPAEANELDTLLPLFPDEDPDGLELAAAAMHLALSAPPENMPSRLTEKLHLAAIAMVPAASKTSPKLPSTPPAWRAWLGWAGWAVAASLLAALVYTNWPKPPDKPIPEPTLADKRQMLMDDPTAKAVAFEGEKKAVTGNVVWSDTKQEGYLEVKGLPPVDATAGTYQLWIVDGKREKSEPIDGGTFKVDPDGKALVRIRNPILVKSAAAVAITKESEPGGVVVTKVPPEQWELVLAKKG
jgi:hypothetical protein